MATTLTLALSDGRQTQTQELSFPVLPSSVDVSGTAMPTVDEVARFVKEQPDAATQLVVDYKAGRMDAVLARANDHGLVAARSTSDPQAGAAAVVILIIIAIIIILLFPKPVKAPTRN